MKNIHLIPTNKPSRLWVNNLKRRLELDDDVLIGSNTAKHIYITSDEEIKEGDYIFETDSGYVNIAGENYYKNSTDFKIILTTDPDLIGVQSIDNEFLEWFVKNPSCKEVEVINEQYTQNYHKDIWYNRYKIIIPKEEAAKKEFPEEGQDSTYCDLGLIQQNAFIIGAKWQAERMYSKEEAYKIWKAGQEYWKTSGKSMTFEELTEQFKKKSW